MHWPSIKPPDRTALLRPVCTKSVMEASIAQTHARLGGLTRQPTPPKPHGASLLQCVDAGSAYCPCYLAELGECLECSILRGEKECRCRWPGICVLSHHAWQGGTGTRRQSVRAPIVDRRTLQEDLEIVSIRTTPKLAGELRLPGSFVFVRGDAAAFFDAPMAVLHASPEQGTVTFAYAVLGPKTQRLSRCGEHLWLRGPYWNGITGHRHIEGVRGEACLVVAGGTAQSLAPNVVRSLLRHGNRVTVVLGRPGALFCNPFLPADSQSLDVVKMHFPDDLASLGRLMRQLAPSLLFCGGGELLRGMVSSLASTLSAPPALAWANGYRMCCGEGVCGACLSANQGQPVRRCKALFDA